MLGKQIAERRGMWQMRLLDARKLSRLCKDRAVEVSVFGKDVEYLWQLGLLRADVVASSEELELEGLVFVGRNDSDDYLYADSRRVPQRPEGWVGSTVGLERVPQHIELLFHPFRYYVVHKLLERFVPSISPLSILGVEDVAAYERFVGWGMERFAEYSASEAFLHQVEQWNDVVALTVMTEPVTSQRVFQRLTARLDYDELGFELREVASLDTEERTDLMMDLVVQHMSEHRVMVSELYGEIGLERIEDVRRNLGTATELLDPNKNVQTMLRLAKGSARLNFKGQLGGALYLRTMSEMLRRQAEDTFDTMLPEEDELGFGFPRKGFKKDFYGSDRILDGDERASVEFMRSFGLDYGLRLRWYVEGDTEYGALSSVFTEYGAAGVGIINLEGQIARGKTPAFRSSLRADLEAGIFSLVSIDGDRDDVVRVVKQAVLDDEICGQVFVSVPDFEFHNFTLRDLAEAIARLIANTKETELSEEDRAKLEDSVRRARNADELFKQAREALPEHTHVLHKGEEWGRSLMEYAEEFPKWQGRTSSEEKKIDRPIVGAIGVALSARGSNYLQSRETSRIDPDTWEVVDR